MTYISYINKHEELDMNEGLKKFEEHVNTISV